MQNPLLPETRSELALPIKVGQRVIGALDVHSTQAADFDEMVTVVLQTVADQLAVAIENVRLLQEMQNTLRTMEAVSSRYTQEAWGSLTQSAGRPHGYRYKDQRIEPAMELEPEAQQAWQQSRSVVTTVQPEAGDSRPDAMGALAVPIRVRDQVIGALNIRFKDRQVPSETVSLVQEVADRLALTLESARLYQDTQRRAAREQMTAQITTRIRESLDMQTVLTTAAEQMRQALGLEEMLIQLTAPEQATEHGV
jgi:GAF domain-containing protein